MIKLYVPKFRFVLQTASKSTFHTAFFFSRKKVVSKAQWNCTQQMGASTKNIVSKWHDSLDNGYLRVCFATLVRMTCVFMKDIHMSDGNVRLSLDTTFSHEEAVYVCAKPVSYKSLTALFDYQ